MRSARTETPSVSDSLTERVAGRREIGIGHCRPGPDGAPYWPESRDLAMGWRHLLTGVLSRAKNMRGRGKQG